MRRVCWDPELVRQLFTTEADTKLTADSFRLLHRSFDRMRVIAAKPYVFRSQDGETPSFVGEEDVLNAFLSARLMDPNRIFVLTGEPGAGKSHLTRWLLHQLQDRPDRFPIHIPRRVNTLTGVLQRILEAAGLPMDQKPSTHLLEIAPVKLVRFFIAYVEMVVAGGGMGADVLGRVASKPELEALLLQRVARYQASRSIGGLDGTDLLLPTPEEFGRLVPGATLTERGEAWSALRRHLREALRKLLGLEGFDLGGYLAAASARLTASGRRPVLLLEDITAFDLLHEDLLTFLLDEAAGQFDALVCWTTGFEQAYLRTFQLDRYTARLSLSDEAMQVYALQGEGAVEMVRGYLEAVRPWCKPELCDRYATCMPAYEGLYPFNREALNRMAANLIGADGKQRLTPRNLLDRAIKSYLALAEGDGSFPPLQQPPAVAETLYPEALFRYRESHPAFVALMGWYGREEGGALYLDEAVADLLGVAVPEGLRSGESPSKDRALRLPLVPLPPLQELSDTDMEPRPDRSLDAAPKEDLVTIPADSELRTVPTEATLVVQENRRKRLALQLQGWASSRHPPANAVDLQRGVARLFALFKCKLPVPLAHPAGNLTGLTWGKAQAEANVAFEGEVLPGDTVLVRVQEPEALGRDPELWQVFTHLTVYDTLPPGADLALLARWTRRRWAALRVDLEKRLVSILGMEYEAWLLAAQWTVRAAVTGQTDSNLRDLLRSTNVSLPGDLALPTLDQAEFQRASNQLCGLVEASFSPVKSMWDIPRAERVWAGLVPADFLSRLTSVAHTKVDLDWRIGQKIPFRELVRVVKLAADALLAYGKADAMAALRAELTGALAALDAQPAELTETISETRRLIGLTERYGMWEPTAGEVWAANSQRLETEREQLGLSLERLLHETAPRSGAGKRKGTKNDSPCGGPRGRIARACTSRSEVDKGAVVDYLPLARKVAELRRDQAYQAAVAVWRISERIRDGLGLAPGRSVLAVLTEAVERWRVEAWQGRVTPQDALAVLEKVLGSVATAAVKRALTLLRRHLPGA